jgi:hypothetical protein
MSKRQDSLDCNERVSKRRCEVVGNCLAQIDPGELGADAPASGRTICAARSLN